MDKFGQRLKWARSTAKLSQAKLGKLVGVSQSVISDLENGTQLETALNVQLAVACSVDAIWLVFGKGDPKPVNLEIVAIWNEIDIERKHRLLANAYDLLAGQRGAAVKPTDDAPWPMAPLPPPPKVSI